MRRSSTRWAVLLGALVGGLVAVSYSWTFTPIGRLDYRAAVIARLASWRSAPTRMDAEARAQANRVTMRWLPDYETHAAAAAESSGSGSTAGNATADIAARSNASDASIGHVRFEDRLVPGPGGELPLRIYTPPGAGPWPFYLDIHGGGWWMGNGFPFHAAMVDFAGRSNAIVVSVDYRLAPEHPYPAALDDCRAALDWIARHGRSIGGDPTRIAIGGSSAGGNLAAALAQLVRDEGGPAIAFQYLQVPATDLSGTREWNSYDEAGEGYVLTLEGIEAMIGAYVPNRRMRMSPYVSPLLAGDLSGLPPAFVVTALFDPLRDQGESYARRLEAAGVPVELHREPGALHGFLGSPERARRVQAMAAARVRAALKS